MTNFFPKVDLTGAGRPIFNAGEFECSLLSAVDLESQDEPPSFSPLKSGIITLTTHRLIWVGDTISSAIPLAAISHIFSPKKSIKSMFASPRIRFQVSMSFLNPASTSKSLVVTVVIRGKGDWEAFYGRFFDSWKAKAWENEVVSSASEPSSSTSQSAGGLYGSDGSVKMVGVSGILKKEQQMWESTDKSLQDAFQDLQALMSKAKEMVLLAEKMRQKLLSAPNSQTSSSGDEEMGSKEEMQDWLLSVGIASPVTKESAGAMYHQQLSRQLADFVRTPLDKAGGMVNLIDIYCLFNRARGTELISPEDLLRACSLWEKLDVSIMLRKFDSGVMVVQNKSHSDEEVLARIKTFITRPNAIRAGVTATDAAMTLGIAPAMAKEHLLSAESKGLLCRDISPDGFRFYINLFPDFDPNDLYLVKDYGIYMAWIKAAAS